MSKTVIYMCDRCETKIVRTYEKAGGRRVQFYRFQEINEGSTNFDAFFPDIKRDLCETCSDDLRDWLCDNTDGYHTFGELYEYRRVYHAWACRAWVQAGYPVVKSKRHGNGDTCFGGGWFIVSAQLPTGQVTNHYEMGYWDEFDVPEVDKAPEWDGHSPQDAAERIRDALTIKEEA